MKKSVFILVLLLWALFCVSIVNAATTLTYEYDANGNLISVDGKYYVYNEANQLVKVRHGDQYGPVIAEYRYDHTGQRVKKIENGVTTYYIGKHYEQQKTDTNQTSISYYFTNGERVAKKASSGNISYYHADHLGGTNVVTDGSGNLVERINYYPFGEIKEGGNEKYTYTGKEKDKLTDFYYYEARYYDPDFKHFTQADTVVLNIYDPQDLNKYAYARNNPMKYIDPSGHSLKDFWNASKSWLSEQSSKILKKTEQALNKNIFDYGDEHIDKLLNASIKAYSNMPKEDKKITSSIVEQTPVAGGLISTNKWFMSSTDYIYQGSLYKKSNGAFGEQYTLSGFNKKVCETLPFGFDFPFKSGRFFVEENLFNFSGGEYGKRHSIEESNEILTSIPFKIGFVIESSEYIVTDRIYNTFYK